MSRLSASRTASFGLHFQPVVGTGYEPFHVYAMADCTLTVIGADNADNTALDYDLTKGDCLNFAVKKITAISGATISKIRGWR